MNSLKRTTKKYNSQGGGFIYFLRLLMPAGLPLMQSVLISQAKSVFIPLGATAVVLATNTAI